VFPRLKPVPIESITAAAETKVVGGVTGGTVGGAGLLSFPQENCDIKTIDAIIVTKTFLQIPRFLQFFICSVL
jgi:hypothetical protein